MAETALNFGPDWIRALSHGSSTTPSQSSSASLSPPKYSLAEFRYGREEMLALMPKDPLLPDCLKDFPHLVREKFQIPLALTQVTEDEQRIWSRSVNSDAVLRASGKTVPGNGAGRSGRGGSVDRGRGRGRGGFYQRGLTYDDSEDGPPGGFSRPKPIERSQSANEKDQRWDDRDRRFDRTFSGRGSGIDDSVKQDLSRGSNEYWRRFDKDGDGDWRSTNSRSSDKLGSRTNWRNSSDKDRREAFDRNSQNRSSNSSRAGSHTHQKFPGNHNSWKDDSHGSLPEWSVEEDNEPDIVGTFDSSGAFLETKVAEDKSSDEPPHDSDNANEGSSKDSPEATGRHTKKMPKSSNSHGGFKSVTKNAKIPCDEETVVDKHSHQTVSESSKNIHKNSRNKVVESSTDSVIKLSTVKEQRNAADVKKSDYAPVTLPNVPENVAKSTKSDTVNSSRAFETTIPTAAVEEDTFAHHMKATENMVAQWTEEEEQCVISHSTDAHSPPKKDSKWFYQDPQGEIQGPFTSPEMLEWFSAGYFTMGLMVRRNCDEKFSQLGELIKTWGRVPFMPGNSPPPIRVTPLTPSLPTPITQTIVPNPVAASASTQLPKQDDHLLALQQQLLQQQLMQQQLLLRQAQLQQLLTQLKQQDNFTSLNTQQQQQVLMQQFLAQQQMTRPNINPVSEQPGVLESLPALPLPLLGLPLPSLMKNDLHLWNMTTGSGTWPLNTTQSPSNGSIWDVDISKSTCDNSELEKQKQLAVEQEKMKKAEEERLAREREEKKRLEELRQKQEEERLRLELQKKEEEKKRLEELKRQEEEKKRLEELRKLEEQKRKEEELRKQEEIRKIEEQRRLEDLRRQEEQKRLEELRRKEEERKQEEMRKQEELRKQEEMRKKEENQKKIQMEKEREKQIELEKQKEALRLKELEEQERLQREKEKQKEKEEMQRLAEQKLRSQAPAWGIQNNQNSSQLSLADIQRLQEEKEREEKEERMRHQLLLQQQQAIKQVQQNKNGLSWAKRSDSQPEVKSLAEIQQEEAERLVLKQRIQKPAAPSPAVNVNSGVWGNTNHLSRITAAPPSWSINISTSGFWDDTLGNTQSRKQPSKTNDNAFPALANPIQPATVNSNKSKNVRAKKEEDVVTRLFGTHRKPTDEFTKWCTEAISSMPSSVDVPTFVAFLKDIESPYEVYDYVKSYLGEGKEPREFAKQFLERRSKYRNQAKQTPNEENTLWGPAPAITPSVNKTNVQNTNDCDGNSGNKGKPKKKKNRMQKLDNSMLGFTVQSNPDRLNVGEIDHVEGM